MNREQLAMRREMNRHFTVFHLLEGLRKGLSTFSGPSRSGLILGVSPNKPLKVYDPQNLLADHRSDIERYYESSEWNKLVLDTQKYRPRGYLGRVLGEANISNLNSFGYSATTLYYQMWFTERHPLVGCHGPTVSWLSYAAMKLSFQPALGMDNADTLKHSLESHAPRAIAGHLNRELNHMLGRSTQLRVAEVLDAVAGISTTYEERRLATGRILFLDEECVDQLEFVAKFPPGASPLVKNWKHGTKLLRAVESTQCALVSDGKQLLGICDHTCPASAILIEFRKGMGHLYLGGSPVCTVSQGRFYAATTGPDWDVLDSALTGLALQEKEHKLVREVLVKIADSAIQRRHGCTVVVDAEAESRLLNGQRIESPVQVNDDQGIELARSMAQIDGALLIDAIGRLHAFGCILDGHFTESEDRSRGARYNSALRFSVGNPKAVLLVVSEDGHLSIFHSGKHLTEAPIYPTVDSVDINPPTLQQWLKV